MGQGLVIDVPDSFDLFLTSDWHCGDDFCDYRGLSEMLNRVKKTKNSHLILGGDQMECEPPMYHDGGRSSHSPIDLQIIRTSNALKGVAGQIDLLYQGNHGAKRTVPRVGIDPDLLLAHFLGVMYSRVPTVVQYRTSKGIVRVCGGHGKSGAANSINELHKMRRIYPSNDIYHLGHTHCLYAEPVGSIDFDKNGDEFWSPTWLCRTGSMLRYAGYARYGMMEPKPNGYLVAKIRKGGVDGIEVVKS